MYVLTVRRGGLVAAMGMSVIANCRHHACIAPVSVDIRGGGGGATSPGMFISVVVSRNGGRLFL